MSFINFRTAILCSIFCLCACGLAVNAQEVNIDLSSFTGTGSSFNTPFNTSVDRFSATPNLDGITTSNELIAPITRVVPEADTGLTLTLVNATATTGIDGFGGDNRVRLVVSGLGFSLFGPAQRIDPDINANLFDSAAVEQSLFRLDATHDEFLTLSFNQDVTVSAVVLNNLDPGETFQFGSATNITDLSDMTLPDLTLGTFVSAGDAFGALQTFTFETPIVIPADEEILVGQTGFNPDTLSPSTVGVGFERIILTLGGGDSPLIGDVNLDGMVDFLDIPEFIARVTGGEFQAEADINGDGDVDFLDIPEFIDLLTGA